MNIPITSQPDDTYTEILSSQDVLDRYGITEYTAADISSDLDEALAYKEEQARIFKVLDAADHSDIWKVYNRKIPSFVQTPVNNPITVIKEATKASIMPTSYQGEFRPLNMGAKDLATKADKFFQRKWNTARLDSVNSDAADYAFLHGTSGVLFGWDNDIVDGSDAETPFATKSKLQAKAWHPSNIFPDPYAVHVDEMRYIFFAERKSKAFLRSIPRFANVSSLISGANDSSGNLDPKYLLDKTKQSGKDVISFITCYKRVIRMTLDPVSGVPKMTNSVDIIYLAGKTILDVSKDIRPACIPFVPLYDERIPNNFWGISKCYKVLSMVLSLNQLDSTEATSYFKNQNPPEFVNALAGLNVAEYQRKRDNPDAAYTVNCDPKAVQSYADRPKLPETLNLFRQYLISEIEAVSGVDAAYTGRSYGSVQTTGGVAQMVDRATLRDNTRIKAIDDFIRNEIILLAQFYVLHGRSESFFPMADDPNQQEQQIEMTFDPAELVGRDDIEIDVSNSAPRSNQSYEDAANKIFELQMKYQPSAHGYPDLITPEEFVEWMNIPKSQKNVLLERMRNQMENMKVEEYTAVLTAVGTLVQGGMDPEMAVQEVAKQVEQTVMGQVPAVRMGNEQPS